MPDPGADSGEVIYLRTSQPNELRRWHTGQVSDEGEQAKTTSGCTFSTGILDALTRMDDINNSVRVSSDRIAAREILQSELFNYSETVSEHILDHTVGRPNNRRR
jgi:hypothetical protein